MLFDGIVSILSNGRLNHDQDGKWAKEGKVSEEFLGELIKPLLFNKRSPSQLAGSF
jgi:1,6-anhydro-N-acetylmuramate kinase